MIPAKALYLKRIRHQSAYGTYRMLIDLGYGLWIILGVVVLGSGIWGAVLISDGSPYVPKDDAVGAGVAIAVLGVILGIGCFILGQLFRETSVLIVDIADSITDLNCRYEQ